MNKNILINDSFHASGLTLLEQQGFTLYKGNFEKEELIQFVNQHNISILLVRSATKVSKQIIDACPSLKLIGRGGVGMDNIDEEACSLKNIIAFNTPGGSTTAVAEIVFAHLLNTYRFISQSNQKLKADPTSVKLLKKEFSKGCELKGKTIGVWGTGRIGCEVIRLALSFGMKVFAYHPIPKKIKIPFELQDNMLEIIVETSSLDDFLQNSDIISLHIPLQKKPILTREILLRTKKGCFIVNTSRSGNIDESALLEALQNQHVAHAALDVFNTNVDARLLQHPNVSCTPHLGASTVQGQEKISLEIARKAIELSKPFFK